MSIKESLLWFLFVLMMKFLVGCSTKDYSRQTHAYQSPLPDYWDAVAYENHLTYRINKVEKRIKKIEKEIEEQVDKPHRPIQENQEPRANR